MKILHVITSLDSDRGGPSQSVPALARAQREIGLDSSVASFAADDVFAAIEKADIVHQHGIWEPSLFKMNRVLWQRGTPYVVSLRGTLDRWSRAQKAAKKRFAWALYQGKALHRAEAIVVLNVEEQDEVKDWLPNAKYTIVPNGADAPDPLPGPELLPESYLEHPATNNGVPQSDRPIALFMGRLHHKKGLDFLPAIWSRVHKAIPEAQLLVAGAVSAGQEGTVNRMRQGFAQNGKQSVFELGLLEGDARWSALAQARAFILPSREEGMPMAVLESLAAGVPPVLSPECRMQIVQDEGAGRVVPLEVEPFANAMIEVMTDSSLHGQMSNAARNLAANRFTWKRAAEISRGLYEEILA